MWDQEKVHLQEMNQLMRETRTRPSLLYGVWKGLGSVVGGLSVLQGHDYLFQLTESVETVIGSHYNDQIRELLLENDPKSTRLIETFVKCRDEEWEHLEIAKSNNDKKLGLVLYDTLVQAGCRLAIAIASKI
jgi:ubiquinone biosynthesis monooxygenase Coq7